MDDRTMLKLAAKAAGIEWIPENTEKGIELEPVFGLWLKIHGEPYEGQRRRWNPLANDGDALRLQGGSLWAENVGQGLRVHIRLPACPGHP